jgi:hypothetical protein
MKTWFTLIQVAAVLAGCVAGDAISPNQSLAINSYLRVWQPINDGCLSGQDSNATAFYYKEYAFELTLQNLTTAYQFFSNSSCDLAIGHLAVRYDLEWQSSEVGTSPRFVKIYAFNGVEIASSFLTQSIPAVAVAPWYQNILYTANGLLYSADPAAELDSQGYPTRLSPIALYIAR